MSLVEQAKRWYFAGNSACNQRLLILHARLRSPGERVAPREGSERRDHRHLNERTHSSAFVARARASFTCAGRGRLAYRRQEVRWSYVRPPSVRPSKRARTEPCLLARARFGGASI